LDKTDSENRKSSAWSETEVSAVVDSYFRMLALEREGRSYNKSANRRQLMETVRRSDGSIERKLQNISAVLDMLGVQWINGYKPLAHFQDALVGSVERVLSGEPHFLEAGSADVSLPGDQESIIVAQPSRTEREDALTPVLKRLVGKFDPAERDARNRDLGKAGEKFVVEFERQRLKQAGRDDLAERIRWISELDGDGYGYDVKSFEPDGKERLLEVKTTCGHERTAFWLTKREMDVASDRSDIYRIRRVFHFRNQVRMFEIVPPLHEELSITASAFLATPR
jgi:hypothetical protein